MALSRVGSPDCCTIAIRPKAGKQDYQTRNVVYQYVLDAAIMDNQLESQPDILPDVLPHEVAVEFMHDWQLHDGVDDESENELTTEDMGPQKRQNVHRPRSVFRSRSPARDEEPPPTPEIRIINPLNRETMCEYEIIREDNIAERDAEYLRIFGEPFNANQNLLNLLANNSDNDSEIV